MKTVAQLEIENAELRGQVAALREMCEKLLTRPAPVCLQAHPCPLPHYPVAPAANPYPNIWITPINWPPADSWGAYFTTTGQNPPTVGQTTLFLGQHLNVAAGATGCIQLNANAQALHFGPAATIMQFGLHQPANPYAALS